MAHSFQACLSIDGRLTIENLKDPFGSLHTLPDLAKQTQDAIHVRYSEQGLPKVLSTIKPIWRSNIMKSDTYPPYPNNCVSHFMSEMVRGVIRVALRCGDMWWQWG